MTPKRELLFALFESYLHHIINDLQKKNLLENNSICYYAPAFSRHDFPCHQNYFCLIRLDLKRLVSSSPSKKKTMRRDKTIK